ncbi:MAG: glycosyltransferase family protein [Sedimentisphaerales bacterium]|nr:glycosyltransferase family protein [Sedimentisphaerales bacterium]
MTVAYESIQEAVECYRKGQLETAIRLCDRILQREPDSAPALVTKGCILQSRRLWDEAEQLHRKALSLRPDLAEAHQNLGLILAERGRHQEAAGHYQRALEVVSECAETWNDLGISLRAMGRSLEATRAYQKAVFLKPDFELAWFHLGNALRDIQQFAEAIHAYQKALALRPDYPSCWNNLGLAYKAIEHIEKAVGAFEKAAQLSPDNPEYFNNLGLSLETMWCSDEAIIAYRKAINLMPDFAEAYRNLGDTLKEIGRCEEAIRAYRKALEIRPDYASTWWNLSLALLLSGRLAEGFALYHYRSHPEVEIFTYPHTLDVPRWGGGGFSGKRLLVYCEQGFGDSIQFLRYIPMVKQRGGTVILEVPSALARLARNCTGFDELVCASQKPSQIPFDLCVSIMDLPAIFNTSLSTIPDIVPYIRVSSEILNPWRDRFGQGRFHVGIVWAGNPKHGNDRNRSCRAEWFASLGHIEGVQLHSLQKGPASEQIMELTKNVPVNDLANELGDFADTAAVIAHLDLVITVDTAVAHLAGAMDKPVWLLLPFSPDWRWMLDRRDSPWYPAMRLFRQTKRGDWKNVFFAIEQEVRQIIRSRTGGKKT